MGGRGPVFPLQSKAGRAVRSGTAVIFDRRQAGRWFLSTQSLGEGAGGRGERARRSWRVWRCGKGDAEVVGFGVFFQEWRMTRARDGRTRQGKMIKDRFKPFSS